MFSVGQKIIVNKVDEVKILKIIKNKVILEFEGNVEVETSISSLYTGIVKNHYKKNIFGVGFLGKGIYKANSNKKPTKYYYTWYKMLERCYSEKMQKKFPTYKNCIVSEEWHNFQNFAKWFEENYPKLKIDDNWHLDKDLLSSGNKIYSKETCLFLPANVNTFLANSRKTDKSTSKFIGVSYNNKKRKFVAMISFFKENTNKCLGEFKNEIEASKTYDYFRLKQVEKVKEYLRTLKIYDENTINKIK